MYDYLIVGAGLFGAVFAREATDSGKSCLVIDRRAHTGGNVWCDNIKGINVHAYGAHIFHTSNERVWEYVNRFAQFNDYIHTPTAMYNSKLYNLPFNMNTFQQMWGVNTPEEAKEIIAKQIPRHGITEPKNLEEQALSMVGVDIYEKLIKGYTEKQWGRPCSELPAFIIKRLPLRFTFDNNYFSDRWQGIPIGGYNPMIEKLLEGAKVLLGTDYFDFIKSEPGIAKKTVFTGQIDEFFNYKPGALEYRSVRFETQTLDICNYQNNSVVNYTDSETPYTRIIEHKHFENLDPGRLSALPETVISREYSSKWEPGTEPFYPVNDEKNTALYEQYRELASQRHDVIFGGRLGEYRYYDMDQVVERALAAAAQDTATPAKTHII